MTPQEFISAVDAAVCGGSTTAIRRSLEQHPPGRRPPQIDVDLHHWFQNLSEEDRMMVDAIVKKTAVLTTYTFLLALDHKLALEPGHTKGSFELHHVACDGEKTLLNEHVPLGLSDLFKDSLANTS
jgi:hypothetical protein